MPPAFRPNFYLPETLRPCGVSVVQTGHCAVGVAGRPRGFACGQMECRRRVLEVDLGQGGSVPPRVVARGHCSLRRPRRQHSDLALGGALRRLLPHVEVVWICRPYARPVVAKSKAVHSIRVWEEASMDAEAEGALFAGVDAVVFAFPEPRLLAAAARARVQVRVATGRRWAAFRWANRRMWRSRKRTPEHETAQGLRLLHGLGLPARWWFPERQDWRDLLEWHASSAGDPLPEGLDGAVLLHPGKTARPTVGP